MKRVTGRVGTLVLGLLSLPGLGCSEGDQEILAREDEQVLNALLPEAPALAREVAMIAGGRFAYPAAPALRTSNDGRVGVDLKSYGNTSVYLFAPERLSIHFARGGPGVPTLASTVPVRALPDAELHASSGDGRITHRTLCDGTRPFPTPGLRSNPRTCGASDCYDLTLIGAYVYTDSTRTELWARSLTVQIGAPKTPDATIESVAFTGPPVLGPTWMNVPAFFEPMVTADGHLLVARTERARLTWHRDSGEAVTGTYDVVYARGDSSRAPCDVTQWRGQELYPLLHAPYDAYMRARYGFAKLPLRDPEGAVLAEDALDLQGTYPWIDREGNNVFFTAVSSTLYYFDPEQGTVRTRFSASCVTPGCLVPATRQEIRGVDETSNTRGITVAGLWTHGKMVLLDGLVNNIDYGLGVNDEDQRWVTLYRAGTGPTGQETGRGRLGAGRDERATAAFPRGGPPTRRSSSPRRTSSTTCRRRAR